MAKSQNFQNFHILTFLFRISANSPYMKCFLGSKKTVCMQVRRDMVIYLFVFLTKKRSFSFRNEKKTGKLDKQLFSERKAPKRHKFMKNDFIFKYFLFFSSIYALLEFFALKTDVYLIFHVFSHF